jgi:NAD(P)-dependent dehydrogenase (short-subunit alcohol dehydrogenase family)
MRESYPMRRIARPGEIARAIRYLASPDAGNITGSALAIDGGSTAGR